MQEQKTVRDKLAEWLTQHSLVRRRRTADFNQEIVRSILRTSLDPSTPAASLSIDQILALGQELGHYCPSRWNAAVSALRYLSPGAQILRRRPLRSREFNPPDQSQFASLLSECDRSPRSRAGLVVRFLALTGLRIGEARALTWAGVFPDHILVPGAITKSGRGRLVPILPGAAEVLQRLRSFGDGEHVLPRENARRAIRSACRRARLPLMSHHSFRHLFATRCLESGVDVPTVARWLGHQDGGALVARCYFHLVDGHSLEMAARVRVVA